MKEPLLGPADLATVEAAVRAAEARTTGEVYCVVAEESSDYHATPLAWAAGVALLAPALLLASGLHVTAPDMMLVGGWTASSTFAFSFRMGSALNDPGGSMQRYASICSMWFWTMSRITPAESK